MSDLPRYGLAMIVKNAEGDIRRCLESLRPHIGYYVISDTGSSDATMDIIREVLEGIPGVLREDPFVNFGHNRSIVFAEIRGKCRWVIASDADMGWEFADGFDPDAVLGADAFMIEMGNHTSFSYRLPLVFSGLLPFSSFGRVHEYTARSDGLGYSTVPTDGITIDMLAIDRSSPEKYAMHAALLEESLAENPDNPRDQYYLAQTYSSLGDPRARAEFLKRAEMGGYDAEVFYARFRAAMLAPTWEQRRDELTVAWESRPWRMEPLVALAREYNAHGQHHMAYQLVSLIPPQNPDILFVHRDCWIWGLKLEKSIAAWWVGRKAEARMLCDELLADKRTPEHIRAQVAINREFP